MKNLRKKILDVPIDEIDFKSTIKKIEGVIKNGKSHQIAAVNPEFIMAAKKNKEFKQVLNNSSLNTADGRGILWAFEFLHKIKLKERVTGIDLFWALSKLCEDRGYRIFMLEGEAVSTELTAEGDKKYNADLTKITNK